MTSDGTNAFTWEARNQLASMNLEAIGFQYDPFGRRVGKAVAGSTTNYRYDGVNVMQEVAGGPPTANLLVGGVDEYFTRADSAGARHFLADALGSTLALADSTGAVQTQYTYEPFGNTTIAGSSTNPFQYTGRENDGNGLYLYRARYYHPTLQRFISEDPLEFGGEDYNLYGYVWNTPTNLSDPSGELVWIPVIVGGAGAVFGGIAEGNKAYRCGARGWQLGGAVARGVVAGGLGALAGLATGVVSENPFVGGATASGTYDLANGALGGDFNLKETGQNMIVGGALGVAAGALGPTVRGGSNFNPLTSPRVLGAKAAQLYTREAIGQGLGLEKELAKAARGRGSCGCQK